MSTTYASAFLSHQVPVFIEFNIGNGFYVADHTVEECEQMADFFSCEFHARVWPQLIRFDPMAADAVAEAEVAAGKKKGAASNGAKRRRSKSPASKKRE